MIPGEAIDMVGKKFSIWEFIHVPEAPDDGETPTGMLITGPPTSGKSTLVKILKSLGYQAIDGDEFGHNGGRINGGQQYHFQRYSRELLERHAREYAPSRMAESTFRMLANKLTQLDFYTDVYKERGLQDFLETEDKEKELHKILRFSSTFGKMDPDSHDWSRYDDDVWNMQWILDLEMIERELKAGRIVACTGYNWDDLHRMAERLQFEGSINWIHLNLPRTKLVSRMIDRAKSRGYHFPPIDEVTRHILDELESAVARGAHLWSPDGNPKKADVIQLMLEFNQHA